MYQKLISYDRDTNDYMILVVAPDGTEHFLGYARTESLGYSRATEFVAGLLAHPAVEAAPVVADDYAIDYERGGDLVARAADGRELARGRSYSEVDAAVRVVLATPTPTPAAITAVIEQRLEVAREAQAEAEQVSDVEALSFAAANVKALKRALLAVTKAGYSGALLAAQASGGTWVVVGSQGAHYTVRSEGMVLICDCPHGEKVSAWQRGLAQTPPAGVCWHSTLVSVLEDAQAEVVAEYDARAVYGAAA